MVVANAAPPVAQIGDIDKNKLMRIKFRSIFNMLIITINFAKIQGFSFAENNETIIPMATVGNIKKDRKERDKTDGRNEYPQRNRKK